MLLYIHIPYCDSKCYYCSFNSYVDKFDSRISYMQALLEQLKYELKRFDAGPRSIDSLFIGGGTPSTISPQLYSPIFELLSPYLKDDIEMSCEANPNSATKQWLAGMRLLGINRISFGVQSFDANKLKALNRAHTPKEAIDAIKSAKELGYKHISLDLIYNYKGDSKESLLLDVEQAFLLPIDHISAYELTIEENTPFGKDPQAKQDDESLAKFVVDSIKSRGFEQYEISNFGTYQSRHNVGYWRLEDYIGVGAGAVGFLKDRRYYPQEDIDAYIANPTNIKEERLSSNDILIEKIFLGLRSLVGVDRDILPPDMQERADYLVKNGRLTVSGDIYINEDLFLADEIALYLIN